MFGAKYSRLKFWIWSICLLMIDMILVIVARVLEAAEIYDKALFLYVFVFFIGITWMNVLANRIRDYGSNPWISAFAMIPLANIGLALYYGIVQYKKTVENSNNSDTSLVKTTHSTGDDLGSKIDHTINEDKLNHKTVKNNNTQISSQALNLNEDEIYEKIMLEIEEDRKIKGTWARALAQSEGNKDKAESLYINLRVQHIQEEQQRQIEIKKNQEKQAKLATVGGKELNKPEKDFLNKYGVDIFSSNVSISPYSILINTLSGTKEYVRS